MQKSAGAQATSRAASFSRESASAFRFVAPNMMYEFFAQTLKHPFFAIKGATLVDICLIVRCSAIVSTSLVIRSLFLDSITTNEK